MTLYGFIALDDFDKAEAVWNSVHLAIRQEGVYNISLYQIDSFYVEAWYHTTTNELIRFRPCRTTHLLEPYLSQINIPGLINEWLL